MSSVLAHLLAIREVQVSGGDEEASELTLAARGCLAGSEAFGRTPAKLRLRVCPGRREGSPSARRTARPKRSFVGTSVE